MNRKKIFLVAKPAIWKLGARKQEMIMTGELEPTAASTQDSSHFSSLESGKK